MLSELLSFSVSFIIRCASFCHFLDCLYTLADYLLHTVGIALGKTKRTGILTVFERAAVFWPQYGTGLFQQMFPTSENETVVAQPVEKESYQPVIGRLQRLMQLAFQKRTQYAYIHKGSKKLSLIRAMCNEAQLVII